MTAKRYADYLPLPEDLLEAPFQTHLIKFAKGRGWLVNHTRRAIVRKGQHATPTSVPGWPDLVATRDGVLIFAELKKKGSYPTAEQRAVLAVLRQIPCAQVYVWRPADWLAIREVLL